MHTLEPLHFRKMITIAIMPHYYVPQKYASQIIKRASSVKVSRKARASVKTKSDGTNLPTDELDNFIDEMLLFYEDSAAIVNMSGK